MSKHKAVLFRVKSFSMLEKLQDVGACGYLSGFDSEKRYSTKFLNQKPIALVSQLDRTMAWLAYETLFADHFT